MKKILVILSILGCFTASAQQPSVTPQLFKYDYYKFMGYLASDSGLMLPIRTPNFTPVRAGMSVFNTADTTLHIWSGYNWHPMATQAWVSSIKKIDNQYGSTLSAQTAKFWISDTVKAPVFIATDHVATDSIKSSNRHAVYVGDTLSFYIDSANQVTIGSHEYANSSAGGGRVLTVAGTNNPARGAPHASLELVSAETDRNDSLTSGYYPARIHYTAHTNDSLGSDRRVIAAADAWRSGPTARARGGNWGVFTRQDASQGNGSPELLALWVDRYQTVKSLYNATVGQNLTVTGSIYGTIATPAQPNITSVGTLSGLTVTNPINGSVTGNAGTATALQTARNINGTSFDGSTDITLLVNANSLTGTTLAPNVLNSSLTSVGTLTDLAVTNPITGTITGNAGTATALQTARNINGVSFNGTTDITLLVNANSLTGTTLAPNVLNSSLTSVGTLTGLTVTNPINGSVTGNAGTATALQTARNINGTSFDGSTDITLLVNANSLTGTTLAPNVLNSSLTSVGTLTDLAVTNPITGTITGNAGTATALQTARNINGVSFNGTTDITLLVNANSLTGTTLAPNVLNSSLTSVGTLTGLTVTNPINGSVTGNAVTWNSRVWVGAGSGQPYMVETDGTNFYGSSLAQVKTDLGLPVSGTYVTSFNSRTGAVIPVAGDYSALTETLTNKSIAATQLTGATLPSNITGSSLTSVGTLSTLSVTGNTKLAGKLLLGGENPLANNGSGSMAPIELVGSGGVGLAASDSGSTTDREAYFAGFLRASGTIARKAGVFAVSPGSLSPGNESFMADIHATKVTAGVGADKFALSFIPGMGMQIFPASRDTLLFPGDSILKVNGYITSLKFTKSGGTPLQFLMADGSTTLTNANILNQTAAQSNANFNISGTSTGSIANTDNIAATGQNSFVAINNATDVGTTLNSGSVIAGNYGELDYTSSSGRTIGASNVTGAGLFLMKPKISGSSTINMTQGSGGLRAMSGLTGIFYMPSTAANTSTISHAAGLRSFLYSDNTSNTYTLTNYYGLLLGTSTEFAPSNVTNRYGIFQEGTSDKNVLNGETTMGSVLKLKGYTVATLPTGSVGAICYVTDATGPVYGATLVGGGSVKTVAFYDGTNWTAH